jgi:hypothetical protein
LADGIPIGEYTDCCFTRTHTQTYIKTPTKRVGIEVSDTQLEEWTRGDGTARSQPTAHCPHSAGALEAASAGPGPRDCKEVHETGQHWQHFGCVRRSASIVQ